MTKNSEYASIIGFGSLMAALLMKDRSALKMAFNKGGLRKATRHSAEIANLSTPIDGNSRKTLLKNLWSGTKTSKPVTNEMAAGSNNILAQAAQEELKNASPVVKNKMVTLFRGYENYSKPGYGAKMHATTDKIYAKRYALWPNKRGAGGPGQNKDWVGPRPFDGKRYHGNRPGVLEFEVPQSYIDNIKPNYGGGEIIFPEGIPEEFFKRLHTPFGSSVEML